jgi:hypothetical protein
MRSARRAYASEYCASSPIATSSRRHASRTSGTAQPSAVARRSASYACRFSVPWPSRRYRSTADNTTASAVTIFDAILSCTAKMSVASRL